MGMIAQDRHLHLLALLLLKVNKETKEIASLRSILK